MFSRLPTAIVLIQFSSKYRLILLQEHFEKDWRQDRPTTRVLVIRRYFAAANHVTFRRTRHGAASKTSAVDDHVNIIHANMT